MDVKQYENLRTKAKPIVAKLRKGESVTPDEIKLVEESAKAKLDLWTVKPPLCYIAGMDVRKYITPEIGFDATYKRKLRFRVRMLVKKLLAMDVDSAIAKGVKTLTFGAGLEAKRAEKKNARKAELEAKRAERKKVSDKKKVARDKELVARKERVAQRKEKTKAKLAERAKKLGMKVQ